MDYLLVALGLVGLFAGGEFLVRGSVALARGFAISPLLIGLTVVGFGTSTPELLVSVDAAWRGLPDIALGNVIGSNIANILLIVGIAALVWPIAIAGASLRRDLAVMLVAALVLLPFFMLEELSRPAGGLLVASLVLYLFAAYRAGRSAPEPETEEVPTLSTGKALGVVAIGLVALMVGARFLVDGAVAIARDYAISEAFIGLTIVAVGTSLPELATSLIAAFRRQSEIAIGNVVGSNIFNILGILGVTALVAPIPVAPRFLAFDFPVMIGASVLLAVMLIARSKIGRLSGLALLLGYAIYVYAAQG
ncbi:calcium/sodium antiporter [Chelativorans sp. ZYF759]|uniref:calcium/sodium antiporter n=1 Tax=Chelativorans sp. ZYF759 TaxID=2692213 RepID=UPI00145F5A30|nr:calcium/sodium antiporter [Chelativorans sp. ZYF759]NMG38181.1 calcium/sodium antiporter [Chelativorans sp. ZYF759]